jgi:hypothetical protein
LPAGMMRLSEELEEFQHRKGNEGEIT